MENNPPIINANVHKLRAILSREPHTSEELAELMGLPIGNVRALLHSSKEYEKRRVNGRDAWHWKGFSKK
jgi:hypothetical protein